LALLSSAALASCDTFHGSLLAMTITWPFYPPQCQNGMMNTPPGCQVVPQPALLPTGGQRIEMWAMFQSGAPQRLVADIGTKDPADPNSFTGFSIVSALDPNDPCLVRALDRDDQDCGTGQPFDSSVCGAHMFTKKAHTGPGISDNDALLAQQQLVLQARKTTSVVTPFLAVDTVTTGSALGPLLALVQWNPDYANDPRKNAALAISPTTAADPTLASQRQSVCPKYRDGDGNNPATAHPYFYVGNPHQITKPLSGVQFGFLAFSTGPGSMNPNLPGQNFNGMSFSLPGPMDGITTILITLESGPLSTTFNPSAIQLFAAKRLPDSQAGRGAIRMAVLPNLTPPNGLNGTPAPTYDPSKVVGTISILTDLDSGLD
jgi:hypothetical protein